MAGGQANRVSSVLRGCAADTAACLQFFSRLPVRSVGVAGPRRFGTMVAMLPLASLVIGACGGVPLALTALAGLPHPMVAIAAVAALLLATGGLHEDGLADTADGFGGGATRGRKLIIMRDSRIGTYGVLALIAALLWRIAALSALLDRISLAAVLLCLLAASTVSRACALLPLALLAPAREDGLGHGAGLLDRAALATCAGLAAIFGVALPLLGGVGLGHVAAACGLAILAAGGVTRLAQQQIGGHTGDIAGACQQAGEAGFWLGLLAFASQS